VGGVGREGLCDDHVGRQHDAHAALLGIGEVAPHGVELILLEQARRDGVALGCEEGEEHAASDEQRVDALDEVRDDPELVGDLRTAEHHRVRARGVDGEALQHLEFGRDESAGGARQQLREVVHAGLAAVHDAEAVRDERVAELGELLGEGAPFGVVLAGLPRVETQVLEQHDVAVVERADGRRRRGADGLVDELDGRAEQLRHAHRHRLQRVAGLGLALRAAQVADDHDLRPRIAKLADRGERGADAAVIGDNAVGQRNVQIAADDDGAGAQVSQ
jgi:hypothetical protein